MHYGFVTKDDVLSSLPPKNSWRPEGKACSSDRQHPFTAIYCFNEDGYLLTKSSNEDISFFSSPAEHSVSESLTQMKYGAIDGCKICQFFLEALQGGNFKFNKCEDAESRNDIGFRRTEWTRVVRLIIETGERM